MQLGVGSMVKSMSLLCIELESYLLIACCSIRLVYVTLEITQCPAKQMLSRNKSDSDISVLSDTVNCLKCGRCSSTNPGEFVQ